jgi:hypothetical protein
MSDDFEGRLNELLQSAWGLEDGPPRLAILEEAVRLADVHGRIEEAFRLRKELIHTATFCGHPEKSLVAFSWRLAQCDREPLRFAERDLLWQFKWIVDSLPQFPQITRAQMDEMLDDMTRRYSRCGAGLRAVHKLRCMLAMEMGDVEAARQAKRQWNAAPVESGNDCPACERNHQARYLAFVGKDERSLEWVQPILAGRMRCAEIPHVTLADVLAPLWRLGRVAEAAECHLRGYRLISGNRKFLGETAMHLTFLVQTDNLGRAVQLLERHLPWAVEAPSPGRRFDLHVAALLLLERLRDVGRATVALRLPASFPNRRGDGAYPVEELLGWIEDESRELARRFDARNGNDFFSRRIAEHRRLKETITPHPLPTAFEAEE